MEVLGYTRQTRRRITLRIATTASGQARGVAVIAFPCTCLYRYCQPASQRRCRPATLDYATKTELLRRETTAIRNYRWPSQADEHQNLFSRFRDSIDEDVLRGSLAVAIRPKHHETRRSLSGPMTSPPNKATMVLIRTSVGKS